VLGADVGISLPCERICIEWSFRMKRKEFELIS